MCAGNGCAAIHRRLRPLHPLVPAVQRYTTTMTYILRPDLPRDVPWDPCSTRDPCRSSSREALGQFLLNAPAYYIKVSGDSEGLDAMLGPPEGLAPPAPAFYGRLWQEMARTGMRWESFDL